MHTGKVLKEIRFKGLPDIDWSSVLKRRLIELECNFVSDFVSKNKYIRPFVSKELQFKVKREGNRILTIQENYTCRKSYEAQMNAVRNLVPNDSIQSQSYQKTFHLISGLLLSLYYLPLWRKELRRCGFVGKSNDAIIHALVHIFFFYKNVASRINPTDYNLLLAFYDSSLCEGFMVEYFKKHRVKTATLQHGIFSAFRENELINSGVELRTFHSDYFLCWNNFTLREAKKQGCNIEQFKTCGILGYVGTKYISCKNPSNKTFGVVIGHPSFESENKKLIEGANILAMNIGYKYYLKLHPSYKEEYFADKVSTAFVGVVRKGIPMIDYANMVEFSICGSSSVFAELVYLNHNTIRHSDNGITDKFRDVKCGKIFDNPQDIVAVFGEGFRAESQSALFEELCTIKDIDKTYKHFLEPYC